MKRLVAEGYEEVICQPTHIINGLEYDKMMNMLLAYKDQIPTIKVGTPRLTEEEDYKEACEIVMQELEKPLAKDEAFVFMGHGTTHQVNTAYAGLDQKFKASAHANVFIGTVEVDPTIHELVKEVTSFQPSKIYVTPFMIVAGDHAHNDMAGDSPDSWVCQFENAGFEVCPIIKGLGEYPGIRRMYVEHAQKAIDSMK